MRIPLRLVVTLLALLISGRIGATAQDLSFLTNGLAGYYPFSRNAKDASGNHRDGNAVGPVLTTDRFGAFSNAYSFDGVASRIDLPESIWAANTNELTLSAWILTGGAYAQGLIVEKGSVNGEAQLSVTTGKIQFSAQLVAPSGWQTASTTLPTNALTHVVGIYQRGERVELWTNGVLADKFQPPDANLATDKVNGTTTHIGLYRTNFPAAFKGVIDEVRIYNRALSPTEVQSLYRYETTPPLPRVAKAAVEVVNGFLVGITLTDGGYGYTSAPAVRIVGGNGSGAEGTASVSNYVVTAVKVANPGAGYTGTPTVEFDLPPFPPRRATGSAEIVNGFVVGLTVTDDGHGYVDPPAVFLSGGGGSGATASAVVVDGLVTALVVNNPGSGYTAPPTVTIAAPPSAPTLAIQVSRVRVTLNVTLGLKYQVQASNDLKAWAPVGAPFVAQAESLVQEYDVDDTGKYFRLLQVP